MMWNEGEEYKTGFFYRMVWKDVELFRNFPSMRVLDTKKYIYDTQMLQNKKLAIRMTSRVS